MKTKPIMWIFVFFILAANAFALGIAPAQNNLRFEPGSEINLTYTIINNEARELDIAVSALGELAEFIKVPEKTIHLDDTEKEKRFTVSINLPNNLEPGERLAKIRLTESDPKMILGNNQVSVRLEVNSKITINVPYPKKYVIVDFNVDAEKDGNLKVSTDITNVGTTDIDKLKIRFAIASENNTFEIIETEEISIPRRETKTLSADFSDLKIPQGEYSAIAKVDYDGTDAVLIRDFNIGDINITILDYTKYFVQGELNKFEIHVKSEWNKKLKNVFAVIFIEGFEKLKSINYDLDPQEEKTIVSYWDTTGVELGEYDSNITLNYVDKAATFQGKVYVVDISEFKSLLERPEYYPYIGIGVLVLTLVNLVLFFIIGRRKKKHGRRK